MNQEQPVQEQPDPEKAAGILAKLDPWLRREYDPWITRAYYTAMVFVLLYGALSYLVSYLPLANVILSIATLSIGVGLPTFFFYARYRSPSFLRPPFIFASTLGLSYHSYQQVFLHLRAFADKSDFLEMVMACGSVVEVAMWSTLGILSIVQWQKGEIETSDRNGTDITRNCFGFQAFGPFRVACLRGRTASAVA